MNELRKRFLRESLDYNIPEVFTVAVKFPSGSIEVITYTSGIFAEMDYYTRKYDDNFCLKSNPNQQIVGFMLIEGI